MSPRLKLRAAATPLVLAGVIWGSAAPMANAFGPRTQAPPPCSPDGVCLPKWDTYGVYQTRWRPFPGDVILAAPTPAGEEPGAAEAEEGLGGPQEPEPARESSLGPVRPSREAAEEAAPAEGAPAGAPAPGDAAGIPNLEGLGAPTPLPPPGGEPGGAVPGAGTLEGGVPASEEPFGARRPQRPAWLRNPESVQVRLERLPLVEAPAAAAEPIQARQPAVTDGPNLHGDDAPPALPASLERLSQGMSHTPPAWTPGQLNALPPVIQPASVRGAADRNVTPASSDDAEAGQVIPAVGGEETVGHPDQALYIEASDQPVALPPLE
jgi:hypothetical protein